MIRLACALQLVAIALTLSMLHDTGNSTATQLVFVGVPCLGLGLLLSVIVLWRARQGPRPLNASLDRSS